MAFDRTADAVAGYEAALRLDPNSAMAHLQLALALRRLGRLDEAQRRDREAARLRATASGG